MRFDPVPCVVVRREHRQYRIDGEFPDLVAALRHLRKTEGFAVLSREGSVLAACVKGTTGISRAGEMDRLMRWAAKWASARK